MPVTNRKFNFVILMSLVITLSLLAACSGPAARTEPVAAKETATPTPAAVSVSDNRPVILAFGDSLTAGFGLDPSQAYPGLLQRRLDEKGYKYHVVNAGVSGDTTAQGLNRLDYTLKKVGKVEVMILEFGANDVFRDKDLKSLQKNLAAMIEKAQSEKITVILAGMEIPTNFGEDYQRDFHNIYPDLAKQYKLKLIPFFLTNVAGKPELNQGDGIHPNIEGTKLVLDNVWQVLEPSLKK